MHRAPGVVVTVDSVVVFAGAVCTDSSLVDDGIQRSGSRSSDNSRGGGVSSSGGGALGFSTSVPIDVPAWMGSSVNQTSYNYHDDDDVNHRLAFLLKELLLH